MKSYPRCGFPACDDDMLDRRTRIATGSLGLVTAGKERVGSLKTAADKNREVQRPIAYNK